MAEVKLFGQLREFCGTASLQSAATDTDSLRQELEMRYPALAGNVFAIAVNHQIQSVNCLLNEGDIVALMPPFSGG